MDSQCLPARDRPAAAEAPVRTEGPVYTCRYKCRTSTVSYRNQENPFLPRESARGHWWSASSLLEGGTKQPYQWHLSAVGLRLLLSADARALLMTSSHSEGCPDVAFTAELDGKDGLGLNESNPGFAGELVTTAPPTHCCSLSDGAVFLFASCEC